MTLSPPLGLYVHLPWCIRKCPYCDFNSYELKGSLPENAYIDALLRDLETELPLVAGRTLESIFIGGGTPSLFSAEAITGLIEGIRARIDTVPDVEITLEANPGAAEARQFAGFRTAGINRLSIGVQSLRDPMLGAIGRVHDRGEAIAAVEAARQAEFENLNVDLMYGLPGDDVAGALDDLGQAMTLGCSHVSWYQLTLEPQTRFERYPPALPDDATIATMETRGRALLAEGGFCRYEVSAYARPGFRCRHNLNYWRFGDYLGIGAGAHGKVTLPDGHSIERRSRTRNPRTWMERAGAEDAVAVDRIDTTDTLILEFLMNSLRLIDGVETELFVDRTGLAPAAIAGLAEARRRGWMTTGPDRLATTPAGLQSLNRLLTLL